MEATKKIKVCHITTVHKWDDIRIFHKECKSLKEFGFQVSLLVAGYEDSIQDGIKIIGIKKEKSRFKRIIKSTRNAYKKAVKEDADIYHFHDPELLSVGKKLIKKNKIVVYDSHEDLPRQILTKGWIPSFLRGFISKMIEAYENRLAKSMSAIVTSTPFIQKRFAKINDHSLAICNYPILSENEDVVKWSEKKNQACYVGGISELRGVKKNVDAIEKITDVSLVLAGSFENENLKNEIISNSFVNYRGFVSRPEIKEILNESKVGLVTLFPMPSYKDSLPIKMFEYMLAGIPVVASDFPLWREIVNKHECGVCVNPLDVDEISGAIRYLIDNPIVASEMGERGRQAIYQELNWDKEKEKLFTLYLSLLETKNKEA